MSSTSANSEGLVASHAQKVLGARYHRVFLYPLPLAIGQTIVESQHLLKGETVIRSIPPEAKKTCLGKCKLLLPYSAYHPGSRVCRKCNYQKRKHRIKNYTNINLNPKNVTDWNDSSKFC